MAQLEISQTRKPNKLKESLRVDGVEGTNKKANGSREGLEGRGYCLHNIQAMDSLTIVNFWTCALLRLASQPML